MTRPRLFITEAIFSELWLFQPKKFFLVLSRIFSSFWEKFSEVSLMFPIAHFTIGTILLSVTTSLKILADPYTF